MTILKTSLKKSRLFAMASLPLFFLAIVLFCLSVNAQTSNSENLIFRDTITDTTNWTIGGGVSTSNGYLYRTAVNDYSNCLNQFKINMSSTIQNTRQNFTFNINMNYSATLNPRVSFMFTNKNGSGMDLRTNFFGLSTGEGMNLSGWNGGSSKTLMDLTSNSNKIQNTSIYFNWSLGGKLNANVYLNGTFKGNGSDNSGIMFSYFQPCGELGVVYAIDEISMCNSSGVNIGCVFVGLPPTDTTAPTIMITYPNSSERLDGSLYLFSIIGTSSDATGVNATWINNTAFTNYGTKTAFNFTSTGLTTGNYSLLIFSNDSAGNKANVSVTMLVDVLPPTITDNMGLKSTRLTSFRVNTTATDNYLIFSYNMTCYDPDNNIILSNYTNNILLPNYTWTGVLNLSGHNNWVVSCKNVVYDTHTSNDISIIDAKPLTDTKIEFTEEKTTLNIETSKEYKLITSKLTDRYTFLVAPKDVIKGVNTFKRNYTITSTSKIFYLDKSRYKGHLISGNMWVDFEGSDSIIEIERINDYSVLVRETSTKDNVVFKSVGILNKAEYDFTITKEYEADIPIGTCPTTLENVLILAIAVFIVMVLTYISFAFGIPLLMLLCGFSMMILGFYFMPCIWGIAGIFYIIGLVMIVMSIAGFLLSK